MIQKYTFLGDGTVEFEDTECIKNLIQHAFRIFGYYEPFGMDIVTIFQAHHPDGDAGWFTTDVSLRCVDEIKNPHELCFAYHMHDVFYFAEGGWGKYMPTLSNHPSIPNAVSLHIRIDGIINSVVVNGKYCPRDVITALQAVGYVSQDISGIRILRIGCVGVDEFIPLTDDVLDMCLTDFLSEIQMRSAQIRVPKGQQTYYEVIDFDIA